MSDSILEDEHSDGESHVTVEELMAAKHRAHLRLVVMFLFTVLIFLGLAFYQERQTSQIDKNAKAIAEVQTRTSDKVLCPLYGLFLNIVKHPLPKRVDTPEERKANDEALKVIQTGYDALGCKPPPKPEGETP